MQLPEIYKQAHLTGLGNIKAKSYCPYTPTCPMVHNDCPSMGNLYKDDYRCGTARETAVAEEENKEGPVDIILKGINKRLDDIEKAIEKKDKKVKK